MNMHPSQVALIYLIIINIIVSNDLHYHQVQMGMPPLPVLFLLLPLLLLTVALASPSETRWRGSYKVGGVLFVLTLSLSLSPVPS